MEINKFQVLAHLFFVFELVFFLHNQSHKRRVFLLKFVNQLLFLLEFVEHVLRQLLSIILAYTAVFCC